MLLRLVPVGGLTAFLLTNVPAFRGLDLGVPGHPIDCDKVS